MIHVFTMYHNQIHSFNIQIDSQIIWNNDIPFIDIMYIMHAVLQIYLQLLQQIFTKHVRVK